MFENSRAPGFQGMIVYGGSQNEVTHGRSGAYLKLSDTWTFIDVAKMGSRMDVYGYIKNGVTYGRLEG